MDEEIKKQIIQDLINGKQIRSILKKYKLQIDKLYEFIEKYNNDNNYTLKTNKEGKGREFVNKKTGKARYKTESTALKDILEIRQWVYKHGKLPSAHNNVNNADKEEQGTDKETPMQLENRYNGRLYNIISFYSFKYKTEYELRNINNKDDIMVLEIIKELRENFSKQYKYRILRYANELSDWCEKNKRKPQKIDGIKFKKIKYSEETEEERECRLYCVLQDIKNGVRKEEFTKQERIKLENIVDEINYKFKNKKTNKQGLIKAIADLSTTRSASIEQIKKIADYYNVNKDEVLESLIKDEETR